MNWNRPYCIQLFYADKHQPTRICEGPEDVEEFIEDQRDPGLFQGPIAPPPSALGVYHIEDGEQGGMMYICMVEALFNPVHYEGGCGQDSPTITDRKDRVTCPDCAYICEES